MTKSKIVTELLAPAKDKETAYEAINCGADAVYIGATSFGARQKACNSLEDIKEVVDYAHKFWAKVFVTVNTILTDCELERAVELVKELDKIGVDAVLVQDFGLLYKLMKLQLKIPIHASTQCDNREPEKISFFNKLGISRVVLARELSLEQIKEIHDANPDLELEAFIHGALCVSYSGQCYLSEYIGGRSANRGECAQPCRRKYSVISDDGDVIAENIYPLCLKDFNGSKHIQDMIESGIYSFKIEGRLKDKGYVKNIVSYYRRELDKCSQKSSSGKSVCQFIPNPEKSFNRGFTDYFLNGRTNCYNFESPKSRGEEIGKVVGKREGGYLLKTDKTLSPQDGLCYFDGKNLTGFIINSVKTIKNEVLIYPNKKVEIKIGTVLYRNQDIAFEKLLNLLVKRQIGTEICLTEDNIILIDEDSNTVTIEFPSREKSKNPEKMKETFIKQFSKTGESDFYITDVKIDTEVPFMPISEINALRRNAFSLLMKKRLNNYKRTVQKHISLVPYYKQEVDYRANVHNKTAKEFYEICNCKVTEPSYESKKPDKQVELMRCKHCVKFALGMCKSPKNLILVDEFGTRYPLKFNCQKCEMSVYSSI